MLDSYRPEFHYMTISSLEPRSGCGSWASTSELIPPGIDLETFRPRADVERREDMVLALGRSNPLKNLPLTIDAWRALPAPRPELCLFGIEPELAAEPGIRYVESPSDEQVNELFNEATVFVQTSSHEGFALPPLESMATGGAVVCTDAHGNRDFCVDEGNCLMPEPEVAARLGGPAEAARGPRAARAPRRMPGSRPRQDYAWERRIDALEQFLEAVARPRRLKLEDHHAVPALQRRAR